MSGVEGTPQGAYTIVEIAARDLPPPHTRDGCHKCLCELGYLSRYIKGSGATAVRWVCTNCENYTSGGDLPRWLLLEYKVKLDELPVRVNRIDDDYECAVCGAHAVEWHHWAPRAIFPDWPYDCGVHLCQPHHDEWHARMRAHGLQWPHELVDAT